jgi:invasion protein IalB
MPENGTGSRIALSLAGFSDGFAALENRPGVPTVQGLSVSFPALESVQSFDVGAPTSEHWINETYGDWVVRCVAVGVQSMAPCEMTQRTVNASTKLGLMTFSVAHAPFQDVYAFQLVVPTGVAIGPGLVVMADGRPLQDTAGYLLLQDVKYDICENHGCYVKMGLQPPTMAALSEAALSVKKTAVFVAAYGHENPVALPISTNGFLAALERMRGLARERAVASPSITPPFWK